MPKPKLHPTDARIRDLLRWARAEKIVLSRVHLGDVELEMSDTHLAGKLAGPKISGGPVGDGSDLFRKYGGSVLQKFEQGGGASSEAEANMQDAEDEDEGET